MRWTFFRAALVSAALTIVTVSPSVAAAGDTSTAESLFQAGLEAMKKQDFAGACKAFAGSDQADPSPGTEINLALCNEKQGKTATAWGWFRTAAGLADQRGQSDRAAAARAEAARLEPKLHKLVIQLAAPVDGVAITRDGEDVPSAVLGQEVPVDPGAHTIEVSAPGKKPWKGSVTIAAGPGVERVRVPALEDAPVETTPAKPVPGGDYRPPQGAEDTGSTQRTVGFIVGGAGILALVGAGGLQILALVVNGQANDLKDDEGQVPAANRAAFDSKKSAAKGDQLGAIIAAGVGAAALATGIVLVVTAGGSDEEPKKAARVLPMFGPGFAGAGVGGRF